MMNIELAQVVSDESRYPALAVLSQVLKSINISSSSNSNYNYVRVRCQRCGNNSTNATDRML